MVYARSGPRVNGNRLVQVNRYAADSAGGGYDTTAVAEYAYDGLFRRTEKTVSNSGTGYVPDSDAGGATGILAGDRHEHYYYAGWRIVETTNHVEDGGAYDYDDSAVLSQFVWGTQYIDEPVRYDRDTDGDEDCIDTDTGGSAAYYYHQDANFRVIMLTDEDGDVVERYEYTAYGEPTVYAGYDSTAGDELRQSRPYSQVGNPFMHQGLFRDTETGTYQNRFRQLHSRTGRFMQRDPVGYVDGMSLYEDVGSDPVTFLDPLGFAIVHVDIPLKNGRTRRHFYNTGLSGKYKFDYVKTIEINENDPMATDELITDVHTKYEEFKADTAEGAEIAEKGILTGVMIAGIFIPGPDDLVVAWLGARGLKLVAGKLYDAAGKALSEARTAKLVQEALHGGRSMSEFQKHLRNWQAAVDKLDDLVKQRRGAKGMKARQRLDKEIESLRGSIKGHEREMTDKWSKWKCMRE